MLLRRVIVPLVATYGLLLGVIAYAFRHPAPPPVAPRDRTDRSIGAVARYVAVTVSSGYAFFLLVVLVFHVWIAGQRGAFRNAVAGGAFLAFGVAGPLLVLGSWLLRRRS